MLNVSNRRKNPLVFKGLRLFAIIAFCSVEINHLNDLVIGGHYACYGGKLYGGPQNAIWVELSLLALGRPALILTW